MNAAQAILSGVVQGITEFFPISSSGHLVLLHRLFGFSQPQVAFDIFLHLGTLIAILMFFWRDIISLFRDRRGHLVLLLIATIFTAIIALSVEDRVERLFAMPAAVGVLMIVNGVWLNIPRIVTVIHRAPQPRALDFLSAVCMGIAQGVAIAPGISRSGATITMGILAGVDKETAVRFSFLMALPAIIGATIMKAHQIGSAFASEDFLHYILGGMTALAVGCFTIKALLMLVRKNRLYLFGIYCIVAGTLVVLAAR